MSLALEVKNIAGRFERKLREEEGALGAGEAGRLTLHSMPFWNFLHREPKKGFQVQR